MEPTTPSTSLESQHLLLNKWTYWFDSNKYESQSRDNLSSLEELYTFSTVEQFWGLYDGLEKATSFPKGSDCYYMKFGVTPNTTSYEKGGKLRFGVPLAKAECVWKNLILMCIGENFENSEFLVGVELSIRSDAKFNIYFNYWDDTFRSLVSEIKEYVEISPKTSFKFFPEVGRIIEIN
ncbi:eukaryotic translation initiation factor 4E, putative [Entamoeba histolytica HM-3:IMSS]|uniref:Eukaryotic translation initiation factor 4E, putative n=2 Tax=Entamoeba histolytica TaxID=5759 RepID=M2S8J5_ENTHI|nr:eukaryotic translation initiation factor 4E, putative [Entamoeba histolytica KU27]EMS16947.1 eukaryotic translation initiation factor 4E, putative [Entamoeba histolytica HM-3:IMSS]